ncbi:transferase [Siphonobacter sp. BAB-5385]|uniref:acyltransferase n=1 Tax=unclassified Siphonobacter TaxID=2635712 RepID=UPI000B9E0844|nr:MULTISPECIES: acyltransferase [unclassified Siphonobacter]OZI09234.1 transferase [Siphonobacter sp. BAB-5385]PMD99068.1 transferase [Siphonobacter sp. BAB-5405]
MKRILRILSQLNLNTIRFNFRYLPFNQAIRFPVFVAKQVYLSNLQGEIKIEGHLWPGKVKIGYGEIGIFDKHKSRSIWQVAGKVIFKGACNLGHGSKISVGDHGEVIFGEDFSITAESSLVCYKKIAFGSGCVLSWNILMMDTDLHSIRNAQGELINAPKEIIVGDHVWIGCRCTILKGATIGSNSVVAAGTTINKTLLNENVILGGNPARVLKEEVYWQV